MLDCHVNRLNSQWNCGEDGGGGGGIFVLSIFYVCLCLKAVWKTFFSISSSEKKISEWSSCEHSKTHKR